MSYLRCSFDNKKTLEEENTEDFELCEMGRCVGFFFLLRFRGGTGRQRPVVSSWCLCWRFPSL